MAQDVRWTAGATGASHPTVMRCGLGHAPFRRIHMSEDTEQPGPEPAAGTPGEAAVPPLGSASSEGTAPTSPEGTAPTSPEGTADSSDAAPPPPPNGSPWGSAPPPGQGGSALESTQPTQPAFSPPLASS